MHGDDLESHSSHHSTAAKGGDLGADLHHNLRAVVGRPGPATTQLLSPSLVYSLWQGHHPRDLVADAPPQSSVMGFFSRFSKTKSGGTSRGASEPHT